MGGKGLLVESTNNNVFFSKFAIFLKRLLINETYQMKNKMYPYLSDFRKTLKVLLYHINSGV